MKESQTSIIQRLLRFHKRVTLRMLFEAGVSYESRARLTELRQKGWVIDHVKGETPSDNAWVLISEPLSKKSVHWDSDGQSEMPLGLGRITA